MVARAAAVRAAEAAAAAVKPLPRPAAAVKPLLRAVVASRAAAAKAAVVAVTVTIVTTAVVARAAEAAVDRAAAAVIRVAAVVAQPPPLRQRRTATRLLKSLTRSKAFGLILISCSPSGRCPTYDRCTLSRASIRGLSRAFTGRELLQRSPASFLRKRMIALLSDLDSTGCHGSGSR